MLAYIFVLLAVAVRFMPHPFTFTPVAAALLFFGAKGARRQLWIPLVLLAASDILLTKVFYSYPFSWDHFVTWGWYSAILWLGTGLRSNAKPVRLVGASLTSSISFFLLSNFAVWACWNMYPKNWSGLMTSYALGLPFFRQEVVGDLLFTGVMFATPAVIQALSGSMAKDHVTAA
jgi:uncharacterized protein DUF6580